ncbi:MAG: hypothetical protein WAM05_06015 [Candidatus Binataceae bacterium]
MRARLSATDLRQSVRRVHAHEPVAIAGQDSFQSRDGTPSTAAHVLQRCNRFKAGAAIQHLHKNRRGPLVAGIRIGERESGVIANFHIGVA